MKIILSWFLFVLGEWVIMFIEPVFGMWFEWPYHWYTALMAKSESLQGESKYGPWTDVTK